MNIEKVRLITIANDSSKLEDLIQEYVDNIAATTKYRVCDIKYQLQIDEKDSLYSALILVENIMD